MEESSVIKLYGANGSPYSCKVRAYLRYKRIPFLWTPPKINMGKWPKKFDHIQPKTIPVIEFPDGVSMNESTKIIQKIEKGINYSKRKLISTIANEYIGFMSDLLEDFADEWCTKLMYGMRWNRKIDQDFGAIYVMSRIPGKEMREYSTNYIKKRQIERTKLVGCHNDDEMHASLHEICGIFERYLDSKESDDAKFLFGSVPSSADFAFYGQMRQFLMDMTPNKIMRETYPQLFCWLHWMDDLSGINMDGDKEMVKITSLAVDLLQVCGRVYLPFLEANMKGLQGKKSVFNVDLMINGKVYKHEQKPFKWQGRCLEALIRKFNGMRKDEHIEEFLVLQRVLRNTNGWRILNDNLVSKL